MLNGIDPIILIQLYKKIPSTDEKYAAVPLTDRPKHRATLAIIPIYLSEKITGLYIDSEDKKIDIDTTITSLSSGDGAQVNQKAIGSVVTVNMKAKSNSVGLTILLAAMDMIIDKVTSQEYEITYMHGPVTVFGGLLHGFSFDQGNNDDLYRIKLELSRGNKKSKSIEVKEDPTAVRAGTVGETPAIGSPTVPSSPAPSKSIISPIPIRQG